MNQNIYVVHLVFNGTKESELFFSASAAGVSDGCLCFYNENQELTLSFAPHTWKSFWLLNPQTQKPFNYFSPLDISHIHKNKSYSEKSITLDFFCQTITSQFQILNFQNSAQILDELRTTLELDNKQLIEKTISLFKDGILNFVDLLPNEIYAKLQQHLMPEFEKNSDLSSSQIQEILNNKGIPLHPFFIFLWVWWLKNQSGLLDFT